MPTLSVNPHGQIFVGPAHSLLESSLLTKDGAQAPNQVEIALLEEKNSHGLRDALIQIFGQAAASAGIEGKVIRYSAVPSGTGVDFRYFSSGEERTLLSTREPWGGWSLMQLHLNGASIPISLHPRGTSEARPLHLLTAYNQAQAEAPTRLSLERLLLTRNEKERIKVSLHWHGLEASEANRRAIGALLGAMDPALGEISADPLGKEALAGIQDISLNASSEGGLSVTRSGSSLKIEVGSGLGEEISSSAATSWLVKEMETAL
jgi:hypothetical protein